MKIILELTPNLNLKTIFEEKMTYPMIFGMLKEATIEVETQYRLGLIESIQQEQKAKKKRKPAPNGG